jgi:hypothetical protein
MRVLVYPNEDATFHNIPGFLHPNIILSLAELKDMSQTYIRNIVSRRLCVALYNLVIALKTITVRQPAKVLNTYVT